MEQTSGPFPRGKLVDMRGWRFGRLRVLAKVANAPDGHPLWLTWCDCGILHLVRSGNLRNGGTRSCGCLYKSSRPRSNITHGLSDTPVYGAWRTMLYRCYNPDHPQYHLYGGRGIGVCDEWREAPDGVLQFARDMGNKPAGHSLGLLDFNSDFGPGNCEWVPAGHVARRRRDLRIVTWNGESRAVVEWAEILGIPAKTLKWRLDHWQDVDRAFTQPLRDWANKGAPRKSKERP